MNLVAIKHRDHDDVAGHDHAECPLSSHDHEPV